MRKPDLNAVAHLTALGTILIWGTTYISTKVLLRDFTPIEILFLRFLLGLGALSLIRVKLPFRSWKEERLYLAAGLTGVTLYFLLENVALTLTFASNVGVLVTVAPFFTALLSRIFLREEHLEARFFLGFLLALAGIVLLSYSDKTILKLDPLGDLLALLAALVWGVYSILMKKVGQLGHPMIACTRRTFLYGLVFMVPELFFMHFSPPWGKLLEPVNAFNLLFLGVGASALCFACWNWTVKILGAVRTSVYIYLVPVVTVITAVIVLHEQITPPAAFGMTLALAGLVLSETRSRKKLPGANRGVSATTDSESVNICCRRS